MESGNESTLVKRKNEDQLIIDIKRSKSDNSASDPTAFGSIDVKPRVSAGAENLKGKSHLVHDHGDEATKSVHPLQFFCGICFDYKQVSDRFKAGNCDHVFCTNCICKHVATQIQQSLKVICPNTNCSVELEPQYFLHTILPNEVIDRWELAKCESLIGGEEKTYCPFEDCSVLLVNDEGVVVTSSECPCCHRLFCAQCKVPWHAMMSCEEFQRSKDQKELDNNSKKCPKVLMDVNT